MWYLLLATCVGLSCSEPTVVSEHSTMSQCEAAMGVEYESIKAGQAVMCVERDTPPTNQDQVSLGV